MTTAMHTIPLYQPALPAMQKQCYMQDLLEQATAVISAGPYTKLHHATDRQPRTEMQFGGGDRLAWVKESCIR